MNKKNKNDVDLQMEMLEQGIGNWAMSLKDEKPIKPVRRKKKK